jgi:4-amino-4-deoxy-L-arabinose transferase-like glycosyltransferase
MLKRLLNYKYFWEVALVFTWIVIIFIINPIGEFPLNDDWAYSKTVLHLVKTGTYQLVDWPAMSLIAQVYWGGMFCSILGFSFTVLRISTLVLGLIGIIFFFKLLYKFSGNRPVAFAGTLLLLANPLYVSLSFSFMTDVPFTVFCILSIYYFFSYLKNEKSFSLILALVFCTIATLIRQMGILIPFSFALVYLVTGKINLRLIIKAILPFIISVAALAYYNHWLRATNQMTAAYQSNGNISSLFSKFLEPIKDLLYTILMRPGEVFFYCSVFLLPLVIVIAPYVFKKQKPFQKSIPFWITATFMLIFILIFKKYIQAPFTGNVLYNLGVGPKLLKDTYLIQININPILSYTFMLAISIIGLISMFFLILALSDGLVSLIMKIRKKEFGLQAKTLLLIYVVSFIYLGFLVLSFFFDRYFIFLLPAIIFVLLLNYGNEIELKRNWKMTASVISFLVIGWFSVSTTHDYLSWNRARWKAIDYLMKDKKIGPEHIDGGFEFNCWYQTGPCRPETDATSWWFVNDDEYIISFGRIACYKTLKKFQYPAMIPGKDNNIYILHRDIPIPEEITCDMEQRTMDERGVLTSSKEYQIQTNNTLSNEKAHSGQYSVKLSSNTPFGLQIIITQAKPGDLLEFQVWKLGEEDDVILVSNSLNDNSYYFAGNKIIDKSPDGWELISLKFYVPKAAMDDGVPIYLWYNKKGIAYIDDMKVKIYHLK